MSSTKLPYPYCATRLPRSMIVLLVATLLWGCVSRPHIDEDSTGLPSSTSDIPVMTPPVAPSATATPTNTEANPQTNKQPDQAFTTEPKTKSSENEESGSAVVGANEQPSKHSLSKEDNDVDAPSCLTDFESGEQAAIGTGFFVSPDGFLLTNEHVISGADRLLISIDGRQVPADIVVASENHDIALLKAELEPSLPTIMSLASVASGDGITVLGYPNIGIQGNELKATFGYVNALSGPGGNKQYLQISAPIQPGNSGSPVLDDSGAVVGIVTATLNQSVALESSGTLAQNVNYAVKIPYAVPLLRKAGVQTLSATDSRVLSKAEIVKQSADSVVLVLALRGRGVDEDVPVSCGLRPSSAKSKEKETEHPSRMQFILQEKDGD